MSADIVNARVLPHPRARVFDAFADGARLAAWWGPRGFRNEVRVFEFRPGGAWRFDMVGPNGARYPQEKRFLEVDAPRRIRLRHDQAGHGFELDVRLEEAPGGTRIEWRMRFDEAAEHARMAPIVAPLNEENLDRLAEHLAG